MKGKSCVVGFVMLLLATLSFGQDPGWPRKITKAGQTLLIYQPQVDEWKDYSTIQWRQAFQLTPKGGKPTVGAATMIGTTLVDNEKRLVSVQQIKVIDTYFPGLDPKSADKMDQLLRSYVPSSVNVSLDRVVADLPRPESVNTVNLKNDPPRIFVSYTPAILLAVDGEPVLAPVPKTKLKFVVNTQWPIFLDTASSKYYLLVDQRWFSASDPAGPWANTTKLPKEMANLPKDPQWSAMAKVIPPPTQVSAPVPKIFYSTVPSEMILFDGKPVYAPIPKTQLVYATNTDNPVFVYTATNEYFYLAAGRWFRAKDLQGPWEFASLDLPADFSLIPESSPASAVLASVPGTEEAKDAVLIAQIPTVMEIDPKTAAAQAKVNYNGDPAFAPIEGTSLTYATNTADKVIKVGDVYYLCLQGVWFLSPNAQGPWTTASSVPKEIYTIPPSSPVYNVTYVTQTTTSSGSVESSYTSGYFGAFVIGAAVGAIIANGTGYYYPPYVYYPPFGYPVYRPYPVAYGAGAYYNTRYGTYGNYQTVSGYYGSATRAAGYNPYTGTYTRSAAVATPYGSRSVGEAYNPYTGTYAATRQGSSPAAQWGQSYVSNGSRSAYTTHYSDARGTVGTIQGSQGGRAIASSGAQGNSFAGRTSGGDMYAGHDGNVYRNTGSGWQKYDSSGGSWSSVNSPQAQQTTRPAPNVQQPTVNPQTSSAGMQPRPQAQQTTRPTPNVQQPAVNPQTSSAGMQPRPQSATRSTHQPAATSMSANDLNAERQKRQRGSQQAQINTTSAGSSGGWGGGGRSWSGGSSASSSRGPRRSASPRRR